jgi:hypothetical protein
MSALGANLKTFAETVAPERPAARVKAEVSAESRVPRTMDISFLGGGWSFLLEFSTVIVILFILLCMRILNAITGRDLDNDTCLYRRLRPWKGLCFYPARPRL